MVLENRLDHSDRRADPMLDSLDRVVERLDAMRRLLIVLIVIWGGWLITAVVSLVLQMVGP